MDDRSMARKVAEAVAEAGGRAYMVGGIVRDTLMDRENKDIDIEVHGIEPEKLVALLDTLGGHYVKGSSFGVYGLNGYDLDIAMPRTEKDSGRGHRDFEVFVDPYLGTEKAAERRDFTINAMMQDILTGEVLDHFGGLEDIKKKVLRHVNDASFAEDPLRVLRAAQFAARFEFEIAPETVELCRRMDISALSKERVMGELEKALLKAKRPSIFFEELRKMGQLHTWFPELEPLIGLEQSPVYHPEGDVWIHTMMVLDAAASILHESDKEHYPANPLGFMLSALMHDLGKATTTAVIDGRIRALGHEKAGLPIAASLLGRLTNERDLSKYTRNMIENHMRPNMLCGQNSGVRATNRMFDESVDPYGLILLARCDRRTGSQDAEYETYLWGRLEIFNEMMSRPYVTGDDLIAAGLQPDTNFREILEYAHKLRLSGVPKDQALVQTLDYARHKSE